MKKILTTTAILLLAASGSFAQSYLQQPPLQDRPAEKSATFYDVKNAFENYWETKTPSDTEANNAEEDGYQQFLRWAAFVEPRTFPTGVFPSPEILYNEYQQYKSQYGQSSRMAANWSFLGPAVVPGNGGGAGRINCIEFDPNNANIIYVGTACGGLWKSTDGGATWSSNTDLLPSISISDIAIDPTNTQIMYLATGDKYGIYWQYETWGHYSAGVLKSTDGGATWNPTGLSYSLANVSVIQRLIIDPSNTSTLYAATHSGIFKSTDGAASWNSVRTGKFYDIEMKPGDNTTLYAGDSIGVIKTSNSGGSWAYVAGVSSSGRTSICVTPANAAVVYAWTEGGDFYYSNNSAGSFVVRNDPSSFCTPYGYYDMVLEVSPVNENILFAGGLDIARSTNGGSGWTTVSDWAGWPNPDYVHADNKALKFANGSSQTIFSCNDGGVFRSTDQGTSWSDLSSGIAIKQYYRIGPSYLTANLIYGGAQDNGTDRVTGVNTATQVNGADGEECLVDFTDDNIVFVSSQGGYFLKSTNGGITFTGLTASGCDWTSPLIMDPNNHNVMYMGSNDVMKSVDNGDNWVGSSGSFDGSCIYSLEVCAGSPSDVYAATFGNIYHSTNGGVNWTTITGTLPVSNAAITGIAISDADPDNVWVCFSGFSSGNKVFSSNDGGLTWANISGTLPNVPVNCIEYQNASNDLVYIGTDLGVFYTDGSMNDWNPYNTGLPNVIVDELEIHYPTSKLRAATYGRSIWESDLQQSTLAALDASAISMVSPPASTCDSIITPVVRIRNSGTTTITSAELFYRIDAQTWQQYSWTGSLASFATANLTLNTYTLTVGTHTLTAYTSNPNLSADLNPNNDTIVRTFTIISSTPIGVTPPPIAEGFIPATFPPANWSLENSSGLLSRSGTVGGYGNSTQSVRADFYNIQSGNDMLITMYVDFTNAVPPIRMYFDYAHATYPSYVDSLVIDMFADCPGGGPRLWAKGDPQLSTAGTSTGLFVPTGSQWRTDTLNLDSLAGVEPRQIRFIAKSGFGNELYIDNINITANGVGIATFEQNGFVSVYPNPAGNSLTIEIPALQNGKNSVAIYDMYGNLVRNAPFGSGANRMTIDTSTLSEGIYLVQVMVNGQMETKRISVVR